MREHAVHNAPTCCPQCSAEMQHTEQLSTLQEKKKIPEAESQEIMSGDNIHSLELLFLCRWQLPLMEKIYWYGVKLYTHLGHNSSHALHKNIVKFQMSPGNGRLLTSGKVWINFAKPDAMTKLYKIHMFFLLWSDYINDSHLPSMNSQLIV